jgi:quercetin dioxygenase-like cupin family protein
MTTHTQSAPFTTQLRDQADYTKSGVSRTSLVKNEQGQFSLVCLSAGTHLPEHTAPRNVSVTVIEGRGILTLDGREVALEPGVFVYMPAHTPHSLQALENLAFLHT